MGRSTVGRLSTDRGLKYTCSHFTSHVLDVTVRAEFTFPQGMSEPVVQALEDDRVRAAADHMLQIR